MYSEFESMPVEIDDLAVLVRSKPGGRVSTKLAWEVLDAEDFERLLFNIVSDAEGYANPKWLTRTNAPDRGRDISVDRGLPDFLSGVMRQRIIIQAKHWLIKSIPPVEVLQAVTAVKLWEPPLVNILIIATSGRFTSDAVAWIEQHNHAGERPLIEMWPDSQLETLLAERPHLVAEFRLRRPGT
jgi:restriction endonuclease